MNTKINGLKHGEVPKATNENINENIVSQMTEKEKNMMKLTEESIGYEMDLEEYLKAYAYANKKLEWQGRHFGLQFDEKYRAKVIAEIYEQNAFSGYINTISYRRMRA